MGQGCRRSRVQPPKVRKSTAAHTLGQDKTRIIDALLDTLAYAA